MLRTVRRTACLLALWVPASAQAQTRPLKDVVADYMEGDLETAIIPTPQKAALADTVFPTGKVAISLPESHKAPDTVARELRNLVGADLVPLDQADTVVAVGHDPTAGDRLKVTGLAAEMKLAERGEDGYLLYAAAKGGGTLRNLVVLRGSSPAGDLWALATLRQMAFEKGGKLYIREGSIVDFPRFPFRGNKRPKPWEWRYKANYGWFFQPRQEKPRRPDDSFRHDYFRQHGAWVRHGDPLTASDSEMDGLLASATEAYKAGCREFVLKFDDSGSKMSDATKAAFGGDFFKALHHYLLGMHKRLKALDAANRVYFMPRPYWFNSFETAAYAKALLAFGPLPSDIGLSVCGPEVISFAVPAACLKEYRELFGLKAKAQIYDNFGRGGDLFAYTGRDPDLWQEVCCIFPERGTPVTRITVYDYLWNPEAYDPKRSLQLAVRELASRTPEIYGPLLDYVLAWNANQRPTDYPPRAEALDRLNKGDLALRAKYDTLAPLLEKSPTAVEVKLAEELWGPAAPRPSFEWGEFARLRRRLEFEPYMLKFGWQETRVARAAEAPAIDGRLDEAAWRAAPAFDQFARAAWGMKSVPESFDDFALAGDEATRLRLLHTATHLYIGIEFGYNVKPELPNWAKNLWKGLKPGQQGDYAWRVPCFELFFDPAGRRTDYYQVISNVGGIWLSKHFGPYQPGRSGEPWRPDWRFAFLLGAKSGVFEAAIPLADLAGQPPRSGDAWGFQCFRSKIGSFGLFSGTYDLVGGNHAPDQFGRILFE